MDKDRLTEDLDDIIKGLDTINTTLIALKMDRNITFEMISISEKMSGLISFYLTALRDNRCHNRTRNIRDIRSINNRMKELKENKGN